MSAGRAEGRGVCFADWEEEGDLMGVGETDVVEKNVSELDFAEDPPEAHDEGIARPEGPGCVPGNVGGLQLGEP